MGTEPVSARRVGEGLLNTLLGGMVVAAVFILAARLSWFAELFTHFRAQGAVAGLLLALVFGLLRAPKRAVLAGALALGHVFAVAPAYVPGPPVPDALPRFRLVSANVLTENDAHDAFVSFLRAEAPDVIMVVEVGHHWAAALATLSDVYPVLRFVPQEDNFGVAVLARDPRATAEIVWCGPAGVPSAQVRLPVGEGFVSLLMTHPIPPIGRGAAADRDAQLLDCARVLGAAGGPRVFAGDFNATPWSPIFADVIAASGLLDSRAGFGLQASWMVGFPPTAIPIDHVFHSPDLAVIDRRVGPEIGSDHRPIITDFALLPGSP
jgi:endonuclease/exonuclease/phosphatase (EEP) superfamily protein YafD